MFALPMSRSSCIRSSLACASFLSAWLKPTETAVRIISPRVIVRFIFSQDPFICTDVFNSSSLIFITFIVKQARGVFSDTDTRGHLRGVRWLLPVRDRDVSTGWQNRSALAGQLGSSFCG